MTRNDNYKKKVLFKNNTDRNGIQSSQKTEQVFKKMENLGACMTPAHN